jgi:hypothetical protein
MHWELLKKLHKFQAPMTGVIFNTIIAISAYIRSVFPWYGIIQSTDTSFLFPYPTYIYGMRNL